MDEEVGGESRELGAGGEGGVWPRSEVHNEAEKRRGHAAAAERRSREEDSTYVSHRRASMSSCAVAAAGGDQSQLNSPHVPFHCSSCIMLP